MTKDSTHIYNGGSKKLANAQDTDSFSMHPKFQAKRKSGGGRAPKTVLREITAMLAREGKRCRGGPKRRSYGARGAVRREFHSFSQRVVIKSRIIRTGGRKLRAVSEHLRYLQREGACINREGPCAFNSGGPMSREEVADWAKEIVEDRHHFRMIVSPGRGAELDLRQYAKDFMKQMEFDLNTKLEWLAVTHHNTDNPHVHILLRGVDERGQNLVISRDYISRGARVSAEKIATLELGLRTQRDIEQEVKRSLTKDRFVSLDRAIERSVTVTEQGHVISFREQPADHFAAIERSNMVGRLRHLETLELAAQQQPGLWHLDPEWAKKLKALGIKHDIIKTMHRQMYGIKLDTEIVIFDESRPQQSPLKGTVLDQGLDDELKGSKYLLVEGEDKRAYYVSVPFNQREKIEIGDKVTISICEKGLEAGKEMARTISIKSLSRGLDRDLDLGFGF